MLFNFWLPLEIAKRVKKKKPYCFLEEVEDSVLSWLLQDFS